MRLKLMKDGNNQMNTNSYLIYDLDSKFAYIIDAPTRTKVFIDKIKELDLNLRYVLLTHGHWDHILEVDFWRENYNAEIVAHKLSKQYLEDEDYNLSSMMYKGFTKKADLYLQDDNGEFEIFKYIRTPGHSFDSVIYILGDLVFCGDLIFYNSVGRTDFIGSNHEELVDSIKNIIYKFNDDTKLLPGHGNNTTVAYEKANNPFVPYN